MADEVIAILAIVIGMAAAVLGAVIAQWLLSGQAQRREEQARLEREAAVQVLEEAVRKQVSQEIKEGIEEFAQAMEEHRLKEVIKTIEIATLSRTVLIEELRLDALKRALLEASADNPEIGQLLESSASSPTLGKLMEGLEVPAPRPAPAAPQSVRQAPPEPAAAPPTAGVPPAGVSEAGARAAEPVREVKQAAPPAPAPAAEPEAAPEPAGMATGAAAPPATSVSSDGAEPPPASAQPAPDEAPATTEAAATEATETEAEAEEPETAETPTGTAETATAPPAEEMPAEASPADERAYEGAEEEETAPVEDQPA